jgi:hypothetical protein
MNYSASAVPAKRRDGEDLQQVIEKKPEIVSAASPYRSRPRLLIDGYRATVHQQSVGSLPTLERREERTLRRSSSSDRHRLTRHALPLKGGHRL